MRRHLKKALIVLFLVTTGAVWAWGDLVVRDGNNTIQTIVDFICQSTKHCSAHVLIDSSGAEKGIGANPVRTDPTGTTPQPVTCLSGCSNPAQVFGAAFPGNGQAIGLSDGTNMQPFRGDQTNGVWVNIKASTQIGVTGTFWPYALGQGVMAASVPVTIASNQTAIPVTGTFFPYTLGQKASAASVPVVLASDMAVLPISGTVTANLGTLNGAATAAKQPALGVAGTPSADVISVQGVAGGTAQPISAAALPLAPNAATESTLGSVLTAVQAGSAATGSAVPAAALYGGVNISGNLVGLTGLATGSTVKALTVAIVDGSGTQITSFGGSGSNASVAATGGAVPGSATYGGVNIGGNLLGLSGFTLGLTPINAQAVAMVDASGAQITSFGGPVTIADGASIALGAKADVAWPLSGDGTAIGILKEIALLGNTPPSCQAATTPTTNSPVSSGASAPTQCDLRGVLWTRGLNYDGTGNPLTSATRGAQQALSVQVVDASGNQITAFGTSAAIGATGSAVPASATYVGMNIAGNLVGPTGIAAGATVKAMTVAIVDASGNQITSFGSTTTNTPVAPAAATATAGLLLGGQYNSTQATFSTGQQGALQISGRGELKINMMDAAGNARGANVNASNQLSVSLDGGTGSTVKISDGTNTVGVAPASTPAVNTQPALVTELRPDSPGIITLGPAASSSSVPVIPSSQYPGSSTPINGIGTGSTGSVTGTLAGTSGKTTYICGFDISSLGTAGSPGPVVISGLVGGSFTYQFSTLSTGVASNFGRTFSPCLPASAANTAIVTTTTANATGTAVDVNSWGFQL